MAELQVGDLVVFARGWDGRRIEDEVGGETSEYNQYLSPGRGATITEVDMERNVVSLSIGWDVRPHMVQLKTPRGPEKPPVWSARWTKMMEE